MSALCAGTLCWGEVLGLHHQFAAMRLLRALNARGAQGYLPGQLYNLNSHYGDKEELKALLKAFKEAGVVTLADIVINHRCADAQDENGLWNTFRLLLMPTAHIANLSAALRASCASVRGHDQDKQLGRAASL